jgi:hypothetical protein
MVETMKKGLSAVRMTEWHYNSDTPEYVFIIVALLLVV